jgi:hypothetical protein
MVWQGPCAIGPTIPDGLGCPLLVAVLTVDSIAMGTESHVVMLTIAAVVMIAHSMSLIYLGLVQSERIS